MLYFRGIREQESEEIGGSS